MKVEIIEQTLILIGLDLIINDVREKAFETISFNTDEIERIVRRFVYKIEMIENALEKPNFFLISIKKQILTARKKVLELLDDSRDPQKNSEKNTTIKKLLLDITFDIRDDIQNYLKILTKTKNILKEN